MSLGDMIRIACALGLLAWPLALMAESSAAIAVVIHPARTDSVELDDLALIYRRKQLFWDDGSRINPVNLPARNPLRRTFSEVVLGASPEALERYWNDMYFHGLSPPFVLSSDEAVLRFVAQTPGAVAYVSYCNVDERARVILVLTASGPVSEASARARCAAADERPQQPA